MRIGGVSRALAAVFLCCAGVWAQPPAILPHGVVNAASLMPPGLDAGAVAPGSRVRIGGLRLAGGRVLFGEVEARVLSTSATAIEAIVPPALAAGDVPVRVRTAEISEPLLVRVATGSFGIYDAVHVDGRRYRLRGTGLGSEKNPRVLVGATTTAAGVRVAGSKDGIDEIEFDLPYDGPPALNTSVQVIAGGVTSNSVFLPPTGAWPGWIDFAGVARIGAAVLLRADFEVRAQSGDLISFVDDEAAAAFVNTGDGYVPSALELLPAPGTCATYSAYYYPDTESRSLAATLASALRERAAWESGPSVMLRGAKGERKLAAVPQVPGVFGGSVGGESPENGMRDRPLFLDPGDYTVTAPGGAKIRATAAGRFAWTNRHAVSEVRRDRGFRVDWRGSASGRVMVVVVDASEYSGATGVAWCVPAAGSRTFVVPPTALSNIGPTHEGTLPTSLVIVMEVGPPATTTMPDGSRLVGVFVHASGRSVTFR